MAWVEIDRLDSPTAGAFTFASLTLAGYSLVQVVCSGITVTTDGTDIRVTLYTGAAEITANYQWAQKAISSGGTVNFDGDTSDPSILLNSNDANWDVGNASTKAFGGSFVLTNPNGTACHKKAVGRCGMVGPTGNVLGQPDGGLLGNAGATDGLKVAGSSSLTAGSVIVLGWDNA